MALFLSPVLSLVPLAVIRGQSFALMLQAFFKKYIFGERDTYAHIRVAPLVVFE